MKQWTTTQDFITYGGKGLPVGAVLDLHGDSTVGDNSGTRWKKTAQTGTASTRVNVSTFNDATGSQWVLVCGDNTEIETFIDLQTLQPEDGDFPKKFICVERANAEYLLQPAGYVALSGDVTFANGRVGALQIDGEINTANFESIQSALYRAGRLNRGQIVTLSNTDYTTAETIEIPDFCTLQGQGQVGSRIFADHTSGEVIRARGKNVKIKNILVSRTQNRYDNGDSTCYGIRLESDDEVEGANTRMQQCEIDNVEVYGQPSHNILMIGPALDGTTLTRVKSWASLGHGIAFDMGVITGRVNLPTVGIPGLTTIKNCNFEGNAGHGIACGSPLDNFSTPTLRVKIVNCEVNTNCSDAAVRYGDEQIWLRGANHWVDTTVISGGASTGGIFAAGRNIHLKNIRAINQTHTVSVGNYTELSTSGVYIDGINVVNNTQAVAVLIDPSASGVYVNNKSMNGITKLFDTRVKSLEIANSPQIISKQADQSVLNSTTLTTDDELVFPLAASERVMFNFKILYSGGSGIDIRTTVSGPSGSEVVFYPDGNVKVGSGDTVEVSGPVNDGSNLIFGSTSSTRVANISGYCNNSTTAGNLSFKFAQLVLSSSDAITVEAGSIMTVTRISG